MGPDPDKTSYRFAINRQINRWTELRPRWIEAMGEDSARDIDAELARARDGTDLEDVTHAKDLAEFLDRVLSNLEHALNTRNQLRRNQAAHKAAMLAHNRECCAPLPYPPGTAFPNGSVYLGPPSKSYASLPIQRNAVRDQRADPRILPTSHDLERRARENIDANRGKGLNPELLGLEAPAPDEPLPVERSRTVPGLLHTSLPGLRVIVPAALPADATPEQQAEFEHLQQLAGIYDKRVDERAPEQIAADDLVEAQMNADDDLDRYVKVGPSYWSDDPGGIGPRKLALARALRELYQAAGLDVEAVTLAEDGVQLTLAGKDPITVRLPKPLSELLEDKS